MELTLPGFRHDLCSSVYPLGAGSPLFRSLPLERHGLQWVHPDIPVAHPFDDGTAARLERSIETTSEGLGRDAKAYRRLLGSVTPDWDELCEKLRHPARLLRRPVELARCSFGLARFGWQVARSARGLAESWFVDPPARGLFAGIAAHSVLPLEQSPSAAIGLVLTIAGHAVGWPFARGGGQGITDALVSYLRSLGGEIVTGVPVSSLQTVPPARVVLCDVGPPQLLRLAGDRLPARYSRRLAAYRYGPGAFKLDWALDEPIPWAAEACARAGTVHLGGTLEEIAASERAVWRGGCPERPYVLLAQPSVFDPSRAPEGKQTAWAYCHVPNGSTCDMTERIEAQVERYAPGFRDRVLARSVLTPARFENHNSNLVGGDVNGGALDWRQLLARPALRFNPYRVPAGKLFLCSASTPPGGGVHGMCGYYAALAALRALGKRA
jgi:phytoene dehydrogenase-like protein